jgi:hypothetical protein
MAKQDKHRPSGKPSISVTDMCREGRVREALKEIKRAGLRNEDFTDALSAGLRKMVELKRVTELLSLVWKHDLKPPLPIPELMRSMIALGDIPGFLKQAERFGIYEGFENEIEDGIQWLIDRKQIDGAAAYRRKFAYPKSVKSTQVSEQARPYTPGSSPASPRSLRLYEDYSRNDVHDIFAPETRFTPQRGTWGILEIIPVPDRDSNFAFFVTFGQKQAHHTFEESITDGGVLTWQSQPSQTLQDLQIQKLVLHDPEINSIHLFLRTKKDSPYTYLGRVKYLRHDREREQPVYFEWQLLEWPVPENVLQHMNLQLSGKSTVNPEPEHTEYFESGPGKLTEAVSPARSAKHDGVSTSRFKARKSPDYALLDAHNSRIGSAGERLVVEYEKQMLSAVGRSDLSVRVRNVAELEGDATGYDILSFNPDGTAKFIEVKTTRGDASTDFYVSRNELAFFELPHCYRSGTAALRTWGTIA